MTLGTGIHGLIPLGGITDGTTRSMSEGGMTLGTMPDSTILGITEAGDGTTGTAITTTLTTADGMGAGTLTTDTDISITTDTDISMTTDTSTTSRADRDTTGISEDRDIRPGLKEYSAAAPRFAAARA